MNPSPEISQLVKNLVQEIKSKDINQNNLKRAGTDIEQNMDFNYRQNLEQKFIQLRQEFNTMNPNPNTSVTLNELYNFFVTKNPAVKKEEIQTLFDMNNRDKGLKISLNDFVYIYLLLEEKLKLKKEDLILVKNQLVRNVEDNQEKVKEYENEEYYENGISKENDLSITIIEIKNLTGIQQCKVILNLMDGNNALIDEKETQMKKGVNPEFKEVFSFQVYDYNSYVKCILSDSDTLINEGHGYFVIDLSNFMNQMKQKLWYDVQGDEYKAKVHVACSFIYNHIKKYTDLITKTSKQIDKLTQTIFQMENIIEKVDEPFGLIYNNKIKEIQDKKILHKSEDMDDYLGSSRLSVYSLPRNSKLSLSESPNKMKFSNNFDDITKEKIRGDRLDIIQEEGGEGFSSNLLRNEVKSTEGFLPESYNHYFPKSTLLGKKNTQLIVFGIVISLLNFLFGKIDLFNLCLYVFGLAMAYNMANINGRYDTRRYFFYALLAVIGLDVFWILFLNREQNIQSSFWRVLVFGLTIISLIMKILIIYFIKNRRR